VTFHVFTSEKDVGYRGLRKIKWIFARKDYDYCGTFFFFFFIEFSIVDISLKS